MLKRFKTLSQRVLYPLRKKNIYLPKFFELAGQTFLFRQTELEDIKELLAVERKVYGDQIPWTKSAFLSELTSPIAHLYLSVCVEGQLVGFIGGRIIGNDCHITNIAITPTYQKQGIGGQLIDEIVKFAIMNRCDTVSLEVRMGNKDAQRLYRKKGFISKAVKSAYYNETNEDALDMIKLIEEE
ncbi:ribosomal-protein-alanine N-acetyltransferase [Enterococcus sp. JM4C]|uniref:ribosomal protein S18-alanine N-acetyltransferase n=1 Tax=Candidatus Enterococcus huntleyi TaxID=1857217 RepID=UPI001379E68A|nr:ribosomal protein S18-alanine N-acetyltransferase [Enterococcus sp. JM4C]KAF1296781.1 ribosomal-protein-alanine N-acetyltransferase [Enterococcus sp. JM4C]